MLARHSKCLLVVALVALVSLGAASLGWARPAADSAILFIGDGMGPVQILLGEAANGEPLAMQRMPFSGLATTVSAGGEVTDSAAAATALATGRKTKNGMLAMAPEGRRLVTLETILERSRRAQKVVAVISNDALSGATPAGFAVHVPDRGMRSEIALQLVRSGAQVMMGYGTEDFLPASAGGERKDGKDLLAALRQQRYQLVFTRDELAGARGQRLVGLFEDGPQAPTLAEMVKAALARLSRSPNGFFLMLEQARVDWKPGDPSGVALDVVELDRAVAAALEYARANGRTLVVVTADHETGGLTIERPGQLGFLRLVTASAPEIAAHLNSDRSNLPEVMEEYAGLLDLTDAELNQIKQASDPGEAIGAVLSARAGIRWTAGHTATPVRVYAYGPQADRFTGEMDNTDIAKRMAAALGLGSLGGAR